MNFRIKTLKKLACFGWMPLILQTSTALAGVVVVGNPANLNNLSEDQIVNIYLGRIRSFPDGKTSKPIDQTEGRQPREGFLSKILHKSEPALKSYWASLIFTGNGTPPDVVQDDEEVKKVITSNPNAIGYIDSQAVDSS